MTCVYPAAYDSKLNSLSLPSCYRIKLTLIILFARTDVLTVKHLYTLWHSQQSHSKPPFYCSTHWFQYNAHRFTRMHCLPYFTLLFKLVCISSSTLGRTHARALARIGPSHLRPNLDYQHTLCVVDFDRKSTTQDVATNTHRWSPKIC